ncbi:MAG: TonB family protein [Gemmatimonadota bacterium]|nr:TonB family protein [Gemmatimonadota bacterium]
MIAAWMLWSVGAGLLMLVAGLALEKLLDGGRRWVWLGAGAGTVALTAARVFAGGGSGPFPRVEAELVPGLAPVGSAVAQSAAAAGAPGFLGFSVPYDSFLHALDGIVLLGWVLLSCGLALWALIGTADLLYRRRYWERGTLLGQSILWARDAGPAVVGLLRPRIVLPEWVRGAEPPRQKLILAHEEEHLGAGDAVLRFFMAVLLIAFPWNPALWLHYRRLCLAIELDCDQRVMERLPHRRWLYGELLFRVGARAAARPGLALAAFAERPSFLETRIRKLLSKAPEVGMAKVAFLAFAAIMVIGVAVWVPGITKEMQAPVPEAELEAVPAEEVVEDVPPEPGLYVTGFAGQEPVVSTEPPPPLRADAEPSLEDEPRFVVHTVKPRMLNEVEVNRVLEREYPALLKDAGIGGTVTVWLFVNESGQVANSLVKESSGHRGLDDAALRVADAARFSPAQNRDEVVALWIALDIAFEAN